MILFEIQYSDLQTFTSILIHHNLNIKGLRDIHVFNLIQKLLHHYKFHNTETLFERLNTNPDLIQTCREMLCMTTGEFFRDISLWIQLKTITKKLSAKDNINILFPRIATGEELYSLLIFLQEHHLLEKTTIHATEICSYVLEQAKRATYALKTLENSHKIYQEIGFSQPLLEYFDVSGNVATLKPYLTANCFFSVQSIENILPHSTEYDIIWYRNQLIYWEQKTAEKHLTQITQNLKKGGYLILGYTENLDIYPIVSNFELVSFEDKIYTKK